MLWENAYPKTFDDYYTHSTVVNNLKKISNNIKTGGVFPNIIIHGQEHTGKYTLAKCFLEAIYGPNIYKTTEIEHSIRQNCSTYQIKITKSLFHYETSLSGLQYADRIMLISLIDTFLSTNNISNNNHKIIIIKHFDELTKPAQYALRRRLETSWSAVRYILLVKSINKIDDSVRSRFMPIKCSKATSIEIEKHLINLLIKNEILVNDTIMKKAISLSNNIIGNAVFYLSYMIESNTTDIMCPIQYSINELIDCLYKPIFPYDKIRELIAKLQLSKVSHQLVFTSVIKRSIDHYNNNIISEIIEISAKYDLFIAITNKYSIGIETFMICIFNIIKKTDR